MGLREEVHLVDYKKHLQAFNLSRLLTTAEAEVLEGRTSSAREFFKEFKRKHVRYRAPGGRCRLDRQLTQSGTARTPLFL